MGGDCGKLGIPEMVTETDRILFPYPGCFGSDAVRALSYACWEADRGGGPATVAHALYGLMRTERERGRGVFHSLGLERQHLRQAEAWLMSEMRLPHGISVCNYLPVWVVPVVSFGDPVRLSLSNAVELARLLEQPRVRPDLVWVGLFHTNPEHVGRLLERLDLDVHPFWETLSATDGCQDVLERLSEPAFSILEEGELASAIYGHSPGLTDEQRVVPYERCFSDEAVAVLCHAAMVAKRRGNRTVASWDVFSAAAEFNSAEVGQFIALLETTVENLREFLTSADEAGRARGVSARIGAYRYEFISWTGVCWAIDLATSVAIEKVSLDWLLLGTIEAPMAFSEQFPAIPQIPTSLLRRKLTETIGRELEDLPTTSSDGPSLIDPEELTEVIFGRKKSLFRTVFNAAAWSLGFNGDMYVGRRSR